jgi:hypothetical protein
MSSGVEADIALDAAVVLTLGLNRLLARTAGLGSSGANILAALAERRSNARQEAVREAEVYEQAIHGVVDRNARLAALAEAQREAARVYGITADADIPPPLDITGQPLTELTGWCDAADAALAEAERSVTEKIAAAVTGQIFAVPADGLRTELPAAEPPVAAEAAAREQMAATVARVLARVLPDTPEADRRNIAEAAERVAAAATPTEAEGLLTEVRLRVQRANATTEQRRTDERQRAAERDAEQQAEAERQYVLDAVTAAFTDMGYEVDAGFETLTARDGVVLLTRGDWPQHAVKMRIEDASQIRAAMLRTEEPRSDEERRLDIEREQQWCAAFEAARAKLDEAGIRSRLNWRMEPGEQVLPVTADVPRGRARKQRARQREREA